MQSSTHLILLSIFLVAFASAAIPKDKITSLPDYDGDLGTQYSGYIEVNSTTGQYLHYWFVQSTGNPKTDPVVLWMNGGPGCSSMDGFFYEHGPLHFNVGNGQNNVSLYYNKWTWTTMANMLYLEAPAGVGFSYSNDQNDYNTDDTTTAYYNHRFLDLFFQSYPEFSTNPFYISGESYAGVYVPSLATLVAADSAINFKGILVGNGVTDPNADGLINSFAPFVYGHGLIPMSVYSDIMEYCQNNTGGDNCDNAVYAAEAAVEGLNPYDIYIDCFSQRPAQSRSKRSADVDVPCIDSDAADYYLNLPSVQAAIHVNSDITWSICSNSINYSPNIDTMIPYYKKLIAAGVRILVYSGDVDSVVPYTGTAYWTSNLGLKVNSLWQPWYVSHPDGTQVGGYVTEYEGLTYATVRGSGHMVPQYKPEAAFYMFQSFINGTWGGN